MAGYRGALEAAQHKAAILEEQAESLRAEMAELKELMERDDTASERDKRVRENLATRLRALKEEHTSCAARLRDAQRYKRVDENLANRLKALNEEHAHCAARLREVQMKASTRQGDTSGLKAQVAQLTAENERLAATSAALERTHEVKLGALRAEIESHRALAETQEAALASTRESFRAQMRDSAEETEGLETHLMKERALVTSLLGEKIDREAGVERDPKLKELGIADYRLRLDAALDVITDLRDELESARAEIAVLTKGGGTVRQENINKSLGKRLMDALTELEDSNRRYERLERQIKTK